MRTRSLALLAAAMLVPSLAARPAHATPYTSIIVYGDSLADNGNVYNATGQPGAPYFNGRFSNGPVAVEQLATQLNVPLLDFAYGGATTGIGNIGDFGTPTSLGLIGLPGIKSEFAAFPPPAASIPSSLFIVWGGADDFESLLYPFEPTPTLSTILTTADNAAANLNGIASTLKAAGATSILVPNLPNLGGTPEFAGNAAAIAYSNEFNTRLAATLPAGATLFDTNSLFNSLLTNPGAYGLTDTTDECILKGAFPACTGFLFFDDIHSTAAVDGILARDFAAAVTPVAATPEPSSLVLLGSGVVGVAGLLRRRKTA